MKAIFAGKPQSKRGGRSQPGPLEVLSLVGRRKSLGLVLWEPPFYFSGERGKLGPALRKTPPMGTISKASGKEPG